MLVESGATGAPLANALRDGGNFAIRQILPHLRGKFLTGLKEPTNTQKQHGPQKGKSAHPAPTSYPDLTSCCVGTAIVQGVRTERPGGPLLQIAKAPITRLLYSDASEFAMGGRLATGDLKKISPTAPGLQMAAKTWHRALTLEEQRQGIFCGEVRAIIESIENFLPELRGQVVQFMEDNMAAMHATRRLVSKHPVAQALLRRYVLY